MNSRRVFPAPALLSTLVLAGCAGTASGPATDAATPRPDAGSLVVRCGRLVDGVSDAVHSDVAVVIRGGRIAAVGAPDASQRALPVLDLAGHTCLPGLIDTHTHLADSPGSTAAWPRTWCPTRRPWS